MRPLSDGLAQAIFDLIVLVVTVPAAYQLWRKRYMVRIALLAPCFFFLQLDSWIDLRGVLQLVLVATLGTIAIFYFNFLLWNSVRELASAVEHRRKPLNGVLSILALTCFGLLCIFAQIFSALGMRDTTCNPATVTHNVFEGIYFTIMTWTTVGYGDLQPDGFLCRSFAALTAINGYTLLALLIVYLVPTLRITSKNPSVFDMLELEAEQPQITIDNVRRKTAIKSAGETDAVTKSGPKRS